MRGEKFVVQVDRCCPYCSHDKLITIIQDGVEVLETCASCSKSWEIVEEPTVQFTWPDGLTSKLFETGTFAGGSSSSAGRRAPFLKSAFEAVSLQMGELLHRKIEDMISDTLRSTTVEPDVKQRARDLRIRIRKTKTGRKGL